MGLRPGVSTCAPPPSLLQSIYMLNISLVGVFESGQNGGGTTNFTFDCDMRCFTMLDLLRNKLHSQCAHSTRFQQIEPFQFFFALDYIQSTAKFMECRDLRFFIRSFFLFARAMPHTQKV